MTNKFSIRNLTLRLSGGSLILDDVSLEVPAGSITSIIGPSGSGKSTLLRCLNRLWEPPPGTVLLDGRDITMLDVLELRRRVGMLFQSANLFEGTVASNIVYGPGLQGHSLSTAQVAELLEMVGMEPQFADKSTADLSGGEAQRVALARALANEPEVLLLDEPTSSLDPAATRHVEETTRRLQEKMGLTVVLVSHDIEQVGRFAHTAALLVDGSIVERGSPELLMQGGRKLMDKFAKGEMR